MYKNSKSRVTLKLPGNWTKLSEEKIQRLDQGQRYCTLASQTGLTAILYHSYPDYLPSLSADADFFRQRFTGSGHRLGKETEVLVGGRQAVLLEFFSPDNKTSLNMLLVRKWPVLYVLGMSGPGDGGAWEVVKGGVAEAIEIQ